MSGAMWAVYDKVIGWAEKGFQTSAPVIGSHKNSTHLDITGSGYLLLAQVGTNPTSYPWSIQIDNGSIYESLINGNMFALRFNSRLIIKNANPPGANFNVWVVLD